MFDDLVISIASDRHAIDEADGRYLPSGTSFSSTWQGGHRTLDLQFLRGLEDRPAGQMFDDVRVFDWEGEVEFEGELRAPDPRTIQGESQTQTPQADGYCVAFEDREDVQFLGIDRDLQKWVGPTIDRREELINERLRAGAPSADAGALVFDGSGSWGTDDGRPAIVGFYDASPLEVGRLIFSEARGRNMIADDWVGAIVARDANGVGGSLVAGEWITDAGSGIEPLQESTQPGHDVEINAKAVELLVRAAVSSLADGNRTMAMRDLAVVGTHGLPLIGEGGDRLGLRASDCWRWLVQNFSDDLLPGFIPDSIIAIQHIVETGGQSLGSVLNNINAFCGNAWGVWSQRRVDFHPYGEGRARTWIARAGDPGVDFKEDGETGASVWSDLVVYFTTPAGHKRSVGAPGTCADTTSELLQVRDPTHPAVAAGKRRVKSFQLGTPMNEDQAIAAGYTYLDQLNLSRRAGTATVTGWVEDLYAGEVFPSYKMRGGDLLIVPDSLDATPRRIVTATATPSDGRCVCTLDNTTQFADVLLAHLGAQMIGRN